MKRSGSSQETRQQQQQQQEQHVMMMSMMDRGDIELIGERTSSLSILVPPADNNNNRHEDDGDDDENDDDYDCENPEHNFYEDSTLGDDGSIGGGSDDEGSGEATTLDNNDEITDDYDYDYDESSSQALLERVLPNTALVNNRGMDSSEQQKDQFMATNILLSNENQLLQRQVQQLQEALARFQQQPSSSTRAESTSSMTRSGSSGTLSKLPHNQRANTIRQQRDHAKSLSGAATAAAATSHDPNKERHHPGLHHRHRASYQKVFRNNRDEDEDDDVELAELHDGNSQEPLLLKPKQQQGSCSIKTASTVASTSTITYSPNGSRSGGGGGGGGRTTMDLMLDSEPGTNLELPFWESLKDRGGWLVGLLVLQSMSSFIISRNEKLLQDHIVIVQFLTMLVGAGGNAGNQASVRVIRGLAVGSVNDANVREYLLEEMKMALTMASVLGVAGCIRAAVFLVPARETIAITASLWLIVFFSIVMGSLLPLAMKHNNIDPAHSSTTIQVLMDILGVTITVQVCSLILANAPSTGLPSMVT